MVFSSVPDAPRSNTAEAGVEERYEGDEKEECHDVAGNELNCTRRRGLFQPILL